MSLSNCNMNGSGPSFGGNVLSFDCSANLGNTQIPVGLTGSAGSTFNPDNGGVIQFTVNPNPISLVANPSTQGFTQIDSPGSRNFTITLNSADVASFIWNYTPENDISSSGVSLGNGIQQVSNLNFGGNQLTLPESYTWISCIGSGSQASVTIDCPDPCPDIVRTAGVNAFFVNTPPSFSITSTNTPNDFTIDGCEHEYVLRYHVNISPPQPITLESFSIPINQGIYPITSTVINGQNDNGFDVVVTTDFECEYFQSCGQTNNILYLPGSVQLSYTRPCFPDDIVQVSLPVPNANAGQEFLGTFIGGAQELDYSEEHPTIPVYYEFMTSTGLQFGLGMPNECAMQYQLVITATDINEAPVNISSNLGSTDFTPSITIPIPDVINEVYSNIIFDLTFADCPYPNDPWSGPVTLHAEVQAFCASCSTCYRTLRCIDQTIIAHCNGDCAGAQVGTLDDADNDMPKPDIKRVTFGWDSPGSYKDGEDPLTSIGDPDNVSVNQRLKTFYPYDIFEITAYGHANLGQNVGFEIAYENIQDITFEFIEGKFCSPNSDNGSFDAASCFSTPQPTSGIVFGYDEPLVQQRIWFNCQPAGENFKFRGRFRVKNNRPVGFIENELRLQFISEGSPSVNTSCDSYGNRLTFLSPGYSFDKGFMPINTSGLQLQLDVKNNPLYPQIQNLFNSNTDLCRTSAGLLVSGFGAKGGNNPDFPSEYRPMIDWPARPADVETNVFYTQFDNVVKAIYQPLNLNTSDYDENLEISLMPPNIAFLRNPLEITDPILPAILTSNTLENVNGVYLELKGECANDNIQIVSDQFRFYHHAYVNHESFKLHPTLDLLNNPPIYPYNDVFREIPFASAENFTAQLDFNFQTILQTPTYALNGNNYDIPIAILQPTVPSANGPVHPELQNLLVYYNLTYLDGSTILTDDASNLQPISSFNQYLISNPQNPLGFSYYFNDAIDFSTITQLVGNIPVSLACNENTYRLRITMVHFCDENAYEEYLINGTTACQIIERDLILNPTAPAAVTHSSSIQLINTGADCYLEWNVTLTNPAGYPEIVNPNFVFNTPNGLILESQGVQAQHFFPSNNTTSVLLPLTNPTFSLSAMAPPFAQNSLPTYSLSPVNPTFTLQGNAKIVYTIRFKFSAPLCLADLDAFNLLGRFSGKGFCAEESAPATILGTFIQPFETISPSGNCCVDPPVSVTVINACPGQNGTIIITPIDGANLDGVSYQVINASGIFQNGNLAGTTSIAPISLPIGFYAVLVTLANGNQMSFNANIQNGELSLQLTVPAYTVCQNATFTASVTDINPNNTPTYTYNWADANGVSVGNQNPYTTQNPISGNYTVNVIHTITGCRSSLPFTINVDQPPTPANAGIAQTICNSNATLAATEPTIGNGVWSSTNSDIIFDDPTIENTTVTGLSAGLNILTWTVTSGVCAASFSAVNITVLLPPTADAGADQTVCGANATLAATNLSDGTWTEVSGTGNFISASSNNTGVTGLTVGNNIFKWTVDNHVCPESTDEVIITRNPDPLINLTLPTSLCSQQTYTLNVAPPGGILYANGNAISNNITGPFTLQASSLIQGNNNLSYTATNSYGCSSSTSASINVSGYCPCACVNANATEQIIPAYITTGELLTEYLQTSNPQNKCFLINSDITISNTIIFTNCNLKFDSGKELRILEQGQLKFNNCTLQGCARMWKGIWNEGRLSMQNSYLRDAHNGITMVTANNYWPNTTLINTQFSNNFISLTNSNNGVWHAYKIFYCKFLGGSLLPNYFGQSPFAHPNGGLAGIKVFAFDFSINATNSFSGLFNGIMAEKCLLKVNGTKFSNIANSNGSGIYTGSNYFLNGNNTTSAGINLMPGAVGTISGIGVDDDNMAMFLNCRVGINAFKAELIVNNCLIGTPTQPVIDGIKTTKSMFEAGFKIENNKIRAKRNGISIIQSSSLVQQYGRIINNNISIYGTTSLNYGSIGNGIKISNEGDGKNIWVCDNSINLLYASNQQNGPDEDIRGIDVTGASIIQMSNNKIRRKFVTKGKGISIINSPHSRISCNHTLGWDIEDEPVDNDALRTVDNIGLYLENSGNSTILGNITQHTRLGIQFVNANDGIDFYKNTMRDNKLGLCLGAFDIDMVDDGTYQESIPVSIGPQYNRMNMWEGNMEFGAKKLLSNDQSNIFKVKSGGNNNIDMYYPEHFPADQFYCFNEPFFICLSDLPDEQDLAPLNCTYSGSQIQGYRLANPDNIKEIAEKLVDNSLFFDNYNAEMKYAIKKNIDFLWHDSLLILPDTGNFVQFKEVLSGSNIRKYNSIDKIMNRFVLESSVETQFNENKNGLESLYLQYKYYDSLYTTDNFSNESVAQIMKNLKLQIENYKQNIYNINSTATAQKEVKRTEALTKNTAVINQNEMEYLDKVVNRFYFEFIKDDFIDFAANTKSTIDSIAYLCPVLGGVAVFKARSLQATYNDSITFNDRFTCINQGVYYKLAKQDTVKEVMELLIVFPNPTSEILNVTVKTESNYLYKLVVTNLLGQIVYEKQDATNLTNLNLKELGISKGLYHLTMLNKTTNNSLKSNFVYEK